MAPEDSVVAEALAGAIGAENVDIITPQDPLLRAVEGFQGTLSVHARPNSVDDVQAVVRVAAKLAVPLHPISGGRNWGYGTRLAARDGCALVDLSGMNRVRDIDGEHGTATIEPGVTQRGLADALRRAGMPFYTDVTGSGASTTILGNTLERGIAYNSLRADNLRNLEVVLADGGLLQTGFAEFGSQVAGLYRHGVGPGLTELFLQSNFGIATAATIALRPIPPDQLNFQVALADSARLGEFFVALSDLKRDLGLANIVHVGNESRSRLTLAPIVRGLSAAVGRPMTREEADARVANRLTSEWNGVGQLEGPTSVVMAKKAVVTARMRPFGKVRFFRYETIQRLHGVAKRLKQAWIYPELGAMLEIMGYTRGIPTDAALGSVYWPFQTDAERPDQPDQGEVGWILFTPLMPARDGSVHLCLDIIREICAAHDTAWSSTLNLLTDAVLEAVVSLAFPLDDAKAVARAAACSRALNQRCLELGFTPYRVSIRDYDLLRDRGASHWDVAQRVKKALDPHDIIDPGRYLAPLTVSVS